MKYNKKSRIKVSAPGSVMFMGEHAVLHNRDALIIAINSRLYVEIEQIDEQFITIASDKYGIYKINETLPIALHFLLFVIDSLKISRDLSIKISINSEFSDQIGFGSSAALVVSLSASWFLFTKQIQNLHDVNLNIIFHVAKKIVQAFQGNGSGADVASSAFGGIILYNMLGNNIKTINSNIPLVAIYSGFKIKTSIVINIVQENQKNNPILFNKLFDSAQHCTQKMITYLKTRNLVKCGQIMTQYQQIMNEFGVNNQILQDICDRLNKIKSIYGAKISGSGLGDCVIALGTLATDDSHLLAPYSIYDITINHVGVKIESE
jgi:mevalonate kinase